MSDTGVKRVGAGRRTFFQITFGCQMNKHDSERIAGLLSTGGYEEARRAEDASVIILNTCCVRESAEERLYGRVASLKSLKKQNPDLTIAVGGCLAQNEGDELRNRFSHIDIVFGTHNFSRLPALVETVKSTKAAMCELWDDSQGLEQSTPVRRKSPFQAWVAIAKGCDNCCSYCIVPHVRGREISRPLSDVLAEIDSLAQDGVKEVTLLGQNVNSYGNDQNRPGLFAELLSRLSDHPDIERVRFTTSHPKDLSDQTIRAVADGPNMCEHFHLPLQAGSNTVLHRMNRGYDQKQYLALAASIRDKIPGASITTDIMVGFPGEGESDFLETLRVVEEVRFDQAFTFIFSPRSGTKAFEMAEKIPEAVKADRFQRLMELQNQISVERNRQLQGAREEVLVEGASKKERDVLCGRTRTNKTVNFPGERDLIGTVVPIMIKEVHAHSLRGVKV